MLRKLLPFARPAAPAAVPPGERVYAVGDIHGRLDLLDDLLARIDADDGARDEAVTSLLFLGDLVDRGPDSAGVVERLSALPRGEGACRFLLGNHEEILLLALAGDERATRLFCRVGGRETLLSYGVTAAGYEQLSYEEVGDRLRALVPLHHRAFLAGFENMVTIGDYAFVHAGISPDRPLADQREEDLRWIREPFLSHRGRLEKVIVHGHTVRPQAELTPSRIGIDTGAFMSGRLTAIGLEGASRWLVEAVGAPNHH